MDDRTFDEKNAQTWMATVENEKNQARSEDIYPRLKQWAERIVPAQVLDIGCGQGICAEQIGLGSQYTGVDPSSFLIGRARSRHSRANRSFVEGNIYQLPFEEQSFDAAFSISVWHLLQDPARASSELARVLKPGGHFLLITANPDSYERWKALYRDGVSNGKRFEGVLQLPGQPESSGLRDVLYLHTLREIEEALGQSGLLPKLTETFRPASPGGPGTYLLLRGIKAA